MRSPGYEGRATNPTSPAAWSWTGGGAPINIAASANHADQPWLAIGGGKIFAAYDDFHSSSGERVAVSSDGGVTFTTDQPINNGPQTSSVNPGTRIATDHVGNVYSIFGVGGALITEGVHNLTYYLNRSRDGDAT